MGVEKEKGASPFPGIVARAISKQHYNGLSTRAKIQKHCGLHSNGPLGATESSLRLSRHLSAGSTFGPNSRSLE